jgi:hypothetical protein
MDKAQYDDLSRPEGVPAGISPRDLADQSDRLLVDGYDIHRTTYKLCLEDGEFVCRFYDYGDRDTAPVAWRTTVGETMDVSRLYPNKRIYPETSDYEFIRLLRMHEGTPTLNNWDQGRYGRIHG